MKKIKFNKDDFDGNLVFGGKQFHISTNRETVLENVSSGLWGNDFFSGSPSTRGVRKDLFEVLENCPCCSSSEIDEKLQVNGLKIFQCSECLYGFQNPRIKSENVSKIYEDTYVMDEVYDSPVAIDLDKIKFQYGIQTASDYYGVITSALDVGCGTGLSLDVYQDFGISEVYGIDPGKYTHSKADDRISSSFLLEIPEKFKDLSLITLWDTLEHIHDYKALLKSIYKALAPGGLCLILVPNFLSLATRLMREKSPVFQIDHIHYFSSIGLELSLNQLNFDVIHKETVISEIDNCRNYLEFKEPYFSSPSNEPAFNWLDANFIHSNMLGSRLFFIAKKKEF